MSLRAVHFRCFANYLAIGSFIGCAAAVESQHQCRPEPPPAATPTVPRPLPPPPPAPIGARAYLYSVDQAIRTLDASERVGFLIFPTRPSESRDDHRRICEAFHRNLPDAAALPIGRARVIATYWPLRSFATSDESDCAALLENYDYEAASAIMAAAATGGLSNPHIVGVSNVGNDRRLLTLEFGSTDADSLNGIFAIWRERFALDPSEWEEFDDSGSFRTALVDILNRFGATIAATLPRR